MNAQSVLDGADVGDCDGATVVDGADVGDCDGAAAGPSVGWAIHPSGGTQRQIKPWGTALLHGLSGPRKQVPLMSSNEPLHSSGTGVSNPPFALGGSR